MRQREILKEEARREVGSPWRSKPCLHQHLIEDTSGGGRPEQGGGDESWYPFGIREERTRQRRKPMCSQTQLLLWFWTDPEEMIFFRTSLQPDFIPVPTAHIWKQGKGVVSYVDKIKLTHLDTLPWFCWHEPLKLLELNPMFFIWVIQGLALMGILLVLVVLTPCSYSFRIKGLIKLFLVHV